MNWRFLSPIFLFGVGMLLILLSTLFYPSIEATMEGTRAAIAAEGISEANYWGLTNIFGFSRLFIFLVGIGLVLLDVAVIWLRRK